MKLKNRTIIFIFSFLLTGIIITSALSISAEYYKTHSFFYDPVMPYSKTIEFYERMKVESNLNPITSRFNYAVLYFTADSKAVFLYLPTILIDPQLLSTPWGMLPAIGFILIVFLFTLGYSLFIRNHSLLYCLSIITLFSATPLLLNPERGIISGWHDLPASLFIVSGIISFLNWVSFKKIKWLFICGIFISLACLTRSLSILHSALLLGFPFIYIIIKSFLNTRDLKKEILKPFIILLGIILLLTFPFFYFHFDYNYWYYSNLNQGLGGTVYQCYKWIVNIIPLIGKNYLFMLFLIYVIIIFLYNKSRSHFSIDNILIFGWLILIWPIMWIFIQRSFNTVHIYLIELPILFLFFIPFHGKIFDKVNNKIRIIFPIIIFSFSLITFTKSYNKYMDFAQNPTIEAKESKQLDIKIANYISKLQKDDTWLAYFDDDYTRIPNCEAYYQYGFYPRSYAKGLLYWRSSYWEAYYPKMSSNEIADSLCSLLSNVSFIVTFAEKKDINKVINKDFTTMRIVLYRVNDYLRSNPNWELIEIYSTKKYSDLAFYRKK